MRENRCREERSAVGRQLLHLSNRGRRNEAYVPAHEHLQQVASNSLDVFSPEVADRFDQLERLSEFIAAHSPNLEVIAMLGDVVAG
jgi:hypothetical protein